MLRSLHITNYALIEKIEIVFNHQLNIITGETGAGKSIIIGALALVLGSRTDSKHILNKDKKTIVEAIFTEYDHTIKGILEQEDLDQEDELTLRREISVSGKSRAFINDTPVTLHTLQKLTVHLIDLNRQHEIRDIVDKEFHYKMIDALAGIEQKTKNYKASYKSYLAKQNDLKVLQEKIGAELKERDFIMFQFNELEALGLKEGEFDYLTKTIQSAKKAEDITQTFEFSSDLLSEGESPMDDNFINLGQAWKKIQDLNPAFKTIYEQILNVQEEVRELANAIDLVKDKNQIDIDNIEEKEERLDQINKLMFKHQIKGEEEIFDLMNTLSSSISSNDEDQKIANKLEEEIKKLANQLLKEAKSISKARKGVFTNLEKNVNNHLTSLSMEHASIKVDWKQSEGIHMYGIDEVEILFAPNKGSDYHPIKKVASGGESARLMLCMKSTIANASQLPTMIFDEIDTGVSGDVAGKMGKMLNDLSENHQIIVITHLPQVAAKGNKHFFVYKEVKEDMTYSNMHLLENENRILEIAKMLSGDPPSSSAIENAKDLLK